MLPTEQKNIILTEMLRTLELPDTAYEKAKKRYEKIGEWLGREDSDCKDFKPHIYSQGSFRLGTAIKPLSNKEEYDLDLACELEEGKTKNNSTQKDIKELIGKELRKYRQFRNIQEKLEAKHRCWLLVYQDDLNFHIDIVPCIPEEEDKRTFIKDALLREGVDNVLSESVANLTVAITDDRHEKYRQICEDWKISNPQGYAKWFESRMKLASVFLEKRALLERANIDELPTYKWKTPLQQTIQLLKRYRDLLYKDNPDSKPISIIITTLAAKAYEGETEISEAVMNILNKMEALVNPSKPRVPNPVDPSEDFADKWYDEKYKHLKLEDNFNSWLVSAKADFELVLSTDDSKLIKEQCIIKFGVNLDDEVIRKRLGVPVSMIAESKTKKIDRAIEPWMEE